MPALATFVRSDIYEFVDDSAARNFGNICKCPLVSPKNKNAFFEGILEAPPGFEPGMEVLQTSALPLGDGAGRKLDCTGEIRPRQMRRQQRVERPETVLMGEKRTRNRTTRARNRATSLPHWAQKRAVPN